MVTTPVAYAAKADNATEMKAREAFAAGRYDEALDLFAKLYAQTLHPVYLRNIGRCHQKMRQPDKAIDKFNEYLAKEKKISADERKEIEGYIKEMETLRDEQARANTPPTPPVVTPIAPNNNQPPPNYNYYPPPPPPPQTGTASGTLVAQPGPPQEEAPIYKKWWFWTGVGAVVVAGVVTTVLIVNSGGVTRPDCPVAATGGCK
jgi:tetratricopeptide (TPR) repeat protein